MFIDKFLISPSEEYLFSDGTTDIDQLRYEKHLRDVVADKGVAYPESLDYSDWQYWYKHGSIYVDRSGTYTQPTKITFYAVTNVVAEKEIDKELILWTYGAATIWINGEKAVEYSIPQYKPIGNAKFNAHLKEGENEVLIYFQNLGIRDGRNIFGLEIIDESFVKQDFPSVPMKREYIAITEFLDGIKLEFPRIVFPSVRDDVRVGYDSGTSDFSKKNTKVTWFDASGKKEIEIENGARLIRVEVKSNGHSYTRPFECLENAHALYSHAKSFDENMKMILERIASYQGQSRAGGKFGFFIPNILARKALGIDAPSDRDLMLVTLQQINDNYDCSDFLLAGLIRYMKNYSLDEELEKRVKEVLLAYRYWMTMPGSDAMCFWSENHSLLFYSSAMLVGAMYPEEIFTRSNMTGRELYEFGKKLTLEWIEDLEEYGFEEFNSSVYMNITFVSLLNIIDYAEKDIAVRAKKIADTLIENLAIHTFDGAVISPMGRVYRGIIDPPSQGVQSLLNLAEPSLPYSYGEGWMSFYYTSTYKLPSDVLEKANSEIDTTYSTGNALVAITKGKNAMLTSVQSPRQDGFKQWKNVTLEDDSDSYIGTHTYTKSMNERFHGTTCFAPGVYGYQQHMWVAALDKEAILFANNPGVTSDAISMRPGYWYGNGIMPEIKQDHEMLGVIFDIPEYYPIGWTHVFLPECKFDVVEHDGSWIFLKRGNGYMALWASGKLEKYDDVLFNSELRLNSRKCAYLCFVSRDDDSSFDLFKSRIKQNTVSFDNKSVALVINGDRFMTYASKPEKTQYV